MENSLAVSHKSKYITIIWPRNHTLGDIYLRVTKMYVHTKTWIKIFLVGLFLIVPNWKQHRCPSASEWLNQTVWYYYHGLLLSNTKEQRLGTCNKLDDYPKSYTHVKKANLKCYTLYDSIHITFFKWQSIEMENRLVVAWK